MNALQRLRDMTMRGWIYRDAHYLVVDVELDADKARRFVPWPLRVRDRAQVFLAFFPHTTFGSVYREAGVFFDVSCLGRGIYSPWMLVDDDVALIMGRELLGYPKKLGELTWKIDGDAIEASVARRGHTLLAMRGTLGDEIAKPPPMLGRPHRNVSTGFGVPRVIAFTPRERAVSVREARLEVTIDGSDRDPLHAMGFGRVLGGRLHRVDLGGAMPPLPIGLVSPIAYARSILLRSH